MSLRDAVVDLARRARRSTRPSRDSSTPTSPHTSDYIDEQLAHQAKKPEPRAGASEGHRRALRKIEGRRAGLLHRGRRGRCVARTAAFVFISTYRSEPLLRWPYALIEQTLEFEEHFRLFRFRHARMVERIIGLRVGSGGSAGVEYLDATASRYRIFGDLLKSVSYLIDTSRLPDSPPNPDILRFRIQD